MKFDEFYGMTRTLKEAVDEAGKRRKKRGILAEIGQDDIDFVKREIENKLDQPDIDDLFYHNDDELEGGHDRIAIPFRYESDDVSVLGTLRDAEFEFRDEEGLAVREPSDYRKKQAAKQGKKAKPAVVHMAKFREAIRDLSQQGYEFDYKKGVAVKPPTERQKKEAEKRGREAKGREISIGKLLAKRTKDSDIVDSWSIISDEISLRKDEGYVLILSRNPIDVLRMSDYKGIKSCHSKGDTMFHCAVNEAIHSGLVAYLVQDSQIEDEFGEGAARIENFQKILEKYDGEELFTDEERGVSGLHPVARMRARRLEGPDGDSIYVPEPSTYGRVSEKMEKLIAQNLGRHLFEKEAWKFGVEGAEYGGDMGGVEIDPSKFIYRGGGHRDTNFGTMMAAFFGSSPEEGNWYVDPEKDIGYNHSDSQTSAASRDLQQANSDMKGLASEVKSASADPISASFIWEFNEGYDDDHIDVDIILTLKIPLSVFDDDLEHDDIIVAIDDAVDDALTPQMMKLDSTYDDDNISVELAPDGLPPLRITGDDQVVNFWTSEIWSIIDNQMRDIIPTLQSLIANQDEIGEEYWEGAISESQYITWRQIVGLC